MIDKSVFATLAAELTTAKDTHMKAYREEIDTRAALRVAANAMLNARLAYVRERFVPDSEMETVKHGRIKIIDVRANPYEPNVVLAVFQIRLKYGTQWGKTRYTDKAVVWDFETDTWTGAKVEYLRTAETLR